jgi:heterodisulfide reductase subunit C
MVEYDYKSPDCPKSRLRRSRRSRETVNNVRLKFTGLSGEPTVERTNGRPRNPRVTRGRANGRMGAPDCPVCTGQCPVRQRLQIFNGRLRQFRKAICTGL